MLLLLHNQFTLGMAVPSTVSLICGLCNEIYHCKDGPLMLPCLHSFCKPCLDRYIEEKEKSADNKMVCPTCYSSFPLPEDTNSFPVNLHLSHLARSRSFEKQVEEGIVKCQICDDNPKEATSFCCYFCDFLCKKCKHYHLYMCLSQDEEHEILEFANYTTGKFKIHFPSPKCPQHTQKELDIFCNECQRLVCLDCAQKDHQDHKKGSLDDRSQEEKAELQNLMSGVDEALGKLDKALQQIQEMREKVKVSAENATARIDKACDDLIQAVEDRRKILQRKCREIVKGKDDVLLNQMAELESLRNDLSFAQLHAKDAINSYSPQEILIIKKAIQHRLNQEMESYQHKSMNSQENDTIIVSFENNESFLEEMKKFGYFPGVPDPSKCYAEEVAGEGKEKKVMVILKDERGDPVEGNAYFQYRMRRVSSDPDDYIPPKVSIRQSNESNGTATLGFTSEQLGVYQLTIMVRNRQIANPYKIIARHHRDYKDFRNMPVTYKNVGGNCYGVAVNDNGTIYATDNSNNTIKVFRPDGTEGQIGGPDEVGGGLSMPTMLAIQDNVIYVANNANQMVKMYSTEGRFTGEFGGYGIRNGKFSQPWGICTDQKGRLLVADFNNKRIQVFSSKGVFIESISCSGKPYDVAVDPLGNMHVVLYKKNHITVYTRDGKQIETYSFGRMLQRPSGIHIDDKSNKFICDSGSVYIVDSKGLLISSREIIDTWGITVDRNGVIYVAEHTNKRVSIF